MKKFLFGSRDKNGFLLQLFIYTMLISLGFVYLYPLLDMLVTSLKTLPDLLDASVQWIPTSITLKNYREAMDVMKFRETFLSTVMVAFFPALTQTIVCALTGYGFARYQFPFRKLFLGLVLITFVIPPHVLMVSTYTMFSDYKIIGTIWTLILPATFGQGLKSAIFILIFMQFFSQTPKSLDEAARVDGCGEFKIFWRIAVPLALPAAVMSFLFSFVWYWNETYFTTLYLSGTNAADTTAVSTLLMEVQRFEQSYKGYLQSMSGTWAVQTADSIVNEAIKMAATMVAIIPLLILYFVMQKQFTEGIDRTGITGE